MIKALRRGALALSFGFALAACTGPTKSPPAPPPTTAATAAVALSGPQALMARYLASINAADWDAVVAMMSDSPGFHWKELNRPGYRNKAEYAKALRALKDLADASRMTLSNVQYRAVDNGQIEVTCRYTNDLRLKDGRWMTLGGQFLGVLVEERGEWRFARGETNADTPPSFSSTQPSR